MRSRHEHLAEIMSRVDPARSRKSQTPTDAQLETLRAIMSASPSGSADADAGERRDMPQIGRSPRRTRPIYLSVAAAMAAIVAIAVTLLMTPAPVYAATPPLLSASAIKSSAQEVMMAAASKLTDTAGPSEEQIIRVQMWSLVVTDGGSVPSVVVPEDVTVTRAADGSGTLVSKTGQAYDAKGRPIDDDRAPSPGTVLRDETYGSDDGQFIFLEAPPTSASEVDEYLRTYAGLDDASSAGTYLDAVSQLLMEWDPTPEQERALLGALAELPGLTVAGETTDRLGRDGVVIEAPADGDYQNLLVVSTTTGHILSFETLYVGHDRTDVPSPAVIAYYAWERTPE
ncbi:MAG: CU044_5270 family protein [Microbacterium sp.]